MFRPDNSGISEARMHLKDAGAFLNPWEIIPWKELNEEWSAYTYRIYRKAYNKLNTKED